MRWVNAIVGEALAIFVDDWGDAAVILLWLAVAWAVLPRLGLPSALPPVILFAGLATILVQSALRRARKGRGR